MLISSYKSAVTSGYDRFVRLALAIAKNLRTGAIKTTTNGIELLYLVMNQIRYTDCSGHVWLYQAEILPFSAIFLLTLADAFWEAEYGASVH